MSSSRPNEESPKTDSAPVQQWTLQVGPHLHEVSAREHSWASREIVWRCDGRIVASKRSGDERVVLAPGNAVRGEANVAPDADLPDGLGAIRVISTALGKPRRAIWFEGGEGVAHTGVGGVDLEPEAGSPAAAYEAKAAANPRLYAARHVATGVGKVVLPIIGVWLLARLAGLLPDFSIDLPDLNIPWPDIHLPQIPWPDIPWPDLPDWELPGWVHRIVDNAKYVVPILIGIGLARSEMRRRATQEQRRAELRERRERAETD